jgi:hypothetical protein
MPARTTMRLAALLMAGAAVVAYSPAGWSVAPDDGGDVVVVSSDPLGRGTPPEVDVGVRVSGEPGHRATTPTAVAGRRGPVCRLVPDPDMEAAERGRGTPTVGSAPAGARLYARLCGGALDGWVWLTADRADAGTVSPEVLAASAYRRLRLPSPAAGTSPPAWVPALVRVPVWLWVDRAGWGPRSASAAVPGLSVRAVAAPARVVWSTGDGATVVCQGPGSVFRAGVDDPAAASPDCGHVWSRSSAGLPGGAYVATVTMVWRVRWAGEGRSGVLPDLDSTTSLRLRVAESQAINERMRAG